MSKIADPLSESNGQSQKCLSAALRYLSYRPRGEGELRERLTQGGFPEDAQNAVIAKLTEDGLLNDAVFAQFYKDARDYFRPRSKWMTKQELKQKGISSEIIDQVLGTIDEDDNAYRAATEKSKRLTDVDYETFSRKVGSHLQRRGFNSELIRHILKRVWEERKTSPEPVIETCSCMKNEVKNAK